MRHVQPRTLWWCTIFAIMKQVARQKINPQPNVFCLRLMRSASLDEDREIVNKTIFVVIVDMIKWLTVMVVQQVKYFTNLYELLQCMVFCCLCVQQLLCKNVGLFFMGSSPHVIVPLEDARGECIVLNNSGGWLENYTSCAVGLHLWCCTQTFRGHLNIKKPSYHVRNFHYKDQPAVIIL